jgi:hypothetical protein
VAPADPSNPKSESSTGLKLVDDDRRSDASDSESISRAGGRSDASNRRMLPLWLFVAAVVVFGLIVVWQARMAGELEAQVMGLENELEATTTRLEAHRAHLSEIRGGVRDLSASLEGLRVLVDAEPADAAPEAVAPAPAP